MKDIDIKLKKYVLNKFLSIPSLLDEYGIEYELYSNFFCPMHDDIHHPSARLYTDSDGTIHLFCYAEHKQYGSYEIIQRYSNVKTDTVFYRIWDKLDSQQKEELYLQVGIPIQTIPLFWEKESSLLNPFMSGKMDYREYLEKFIYIVLKGR